MNRPASLFAAFLLAAPAAAVQAPPAAPQPPPPSCTSPEHRAFDFWVGRWDVYRTDTDALVAHSLVEAMYDGCAIRESWMPHGRAGGGSLSSWDPSARRWRQTWVDSANTYAVFEGGMEGEAMVLTGHWLGYNGPGTEMRADDLQPPRGRRRPPAGRGVGRRGAQLDGRRRAPLPARSAP